MQRLSAEVSSLREMLSIEQSTAASASVSVATLRQKVCMCVCGHCAAFVCAVCLMACVVVCVQLESLLGVVHAPVVSSDDVEFVTLDTVNDLEKHVASLVSGVSGVGG